MKLYIFDRSSNIEKLLAYRENTVMSIRFYDIKKSLFYSNEIK